MPERSHRAFVLKGLAAAVFSGSLLVPALASSVQAQPSDPAGAAPAETTESEPSPQEDAAAPASFDSYTYADLFSIGVPEGWQATEQADAPQVVLTNGAADAPEAETARIEITWHDQPPEVVVAELLNELQTNGYQVYRYEPEGIDDTTALNIWLSDLPDDLPNAFMSYIGYADTTAAVVSYYTAPNPPLESLLVDIHESFERLD